MLPLFNKRWCDVFGDAGTLQRGDGAAFQPLAQRIDANGGVGATVVSDPAEVVVSQAVHKQMHRTKQCSVQIDEAQQLQRR